MAEDKRRAQSAIPEPVSPFDDQTPVREIPVYNPATARATVADVQRLEQSLAAHSELDKLKLEHLDRSVQRVESSQEAVRVNVEAMRAEQSTTNQTLADVRVELASWRPVIAKSQAVDQATAVETNRLDLKEKAEKRKKWRDLGFKVLAVIAVAVTGYLLAKLGV